MKWLVIAVVILAQQPTKAPEGHGATKANGTEAASYAKTTQQHKQPSAQAPDVTPQSHVAEERLRSAETANTRTKTDNEQTTNEDYSTQRKLTWFTGVLAGVGILQTVIMILQWLVYRRQAREMRRQRHEMRHQRHITFNQWKALRAQLSQMEIQTKTLSDSVKVAQDSVAATNRNMELSVNRDRARIFVELRPLEVDHIVLATNVIDFRIIFHGPTFAFIEDTAAAYKLTDSKEPPLGSILGSISIPKVIPPEPLTRIVGSHSFTSLIPLKKKALPTKNPSFTFVAISNTRIFSGTTEKLLSATRGYPVRWAWQLDGHTGKKAGHQRPITRHRQIRTPPNTRIDFVA